jgi:probable HAF family extracellular repeat protein
MKIGIGITVAILLMGQEAPAQRAAPDYSVITLRSLGGVAAGASSINAAGWISGLSTLTGDQVVHAALWRHGQVIDLGALGGTSVNSAVAWPNHAARAIAGISETSTVDTLGESWSCSAFMPTTGHTCVGFVWRDGVMTALPTLGGNNGYAAGANGAGQVVGWAETSMPDATCIGKQVLGFQAVLWDQDRAQALPPLPGDTASAATAINDAGQVVGISGTCYRAVGASTAKHAVLWQDGVPSEIPNLGGVAWNTPAAINQLGEVVGFSDLPGDGPDDPNFHAFFWSRTAGIKDLGTLPGDSISLAYAISERGQIVGQSIGAGGSRAFLYEDGAMKDLNALVPAGSPLLVYANDVDDRGEIVGQAVDRGSGDLVPFVATPRR